MALYKYLPEPFATAFVERGEVLFRSLSYFRKIEHAARGDGLEGIHLDAPDDPPTLHNLTTGVAIVDNFRMLNSVDQERVFAFCCSREFTPGLFQAFNCETCVVIEDPALFFLQCKIAAKKAASVARPGLLHRPVEYFAPNRESPLPVRDPRSIPFLKHELFRSQAEYRAVFGLPGGLTLRSRIALPSFTMDAEIAAAQTHERLLRLGDLRGFAKIVSR